MPGAEHPPQVFQSKTVGLPFRTSIPEPFLGHNRQPLPPVVLRNPPTALTPITTSNLTHNTAPPPPQQAEHILLASCLHKTQPGAQSYKHYPANLLHFCGSPPPSPLRRVPSKGTVGPHRRGAGLHVEASPNSSRDFCRSDPEDQWYRSGTAYPAQEVEHARKASLSGRADQGSPHGPHRSAGEREKPSRGRCVCVGRRVRGIGGRQCAHARGGVPGGGGVIRIWCHLPWNFTAGMGQIALVWCSVLEVSHSVPQSHLPSSLCLPPGSFSHSCAHPSTLNPSFSGQRHDKRCGKL